MLDAAAASQLPAAIVVGRTLATPSTAASSSPSPSYFVGEVENNQVTITYTVYNEQADTETGVLLNDTLEPGVTVVGSTVTLDGTTTTQPPDQSGQNLAWSLAPIQGYDRETVALTLDLPALGAGTTPFGIDTGAQAYAMLDAGAVSASTPAATIQPGNVSDPSLLASTVDADTNDPFIQEEAAALGYDPTQIFNFLHTQIGYNSYYGSLRSARGTLWSDAGNALDVASLGVALMRASGIPTQYVSGTLSEGQAQQLILSMFPPSYQTVGYIPAGTQVSDPVNDPQLLAETQSHYWFQFDTGSGMTDADPLIPGATIGQTFTTSASTFTAVPQNLEATTEVQLVAEIYSQAAATFGLSSGLQDTTVLDQTFDDDYLVGRPLSVGNFVSSSGTGFILTAITNTYSPYIAVGDDAFPNPSQDQIIRGSDYQEVFTNFPLGSQVLTGLFLNVELSSPQGGTATYTATLLDRIGYAARLTGGNLTIASAQGSVPALSADDTYTLSVAPSEQSAAVVAPLDAMYQSELNSITATSSSTTTGTARLAPTFSTLGSLQTIQFFLESDLETSNLETSYYAAAYFASPRLALFKSVFDRATQSYQQGFDLISDPIRVEPSPGQDTMVAAAFNTARGILDNGLEQLTTPVPGGAVPLNTANIINQAVTLGIQLVEITSGSTSTLDTLNISPDAKARMAAAINQGAVVIGPDSPVPINGVASYGWYEIDPSTGAVTGVLEDGSHGDEFITYSVESTEINVLVTEAAEEETAAVQVAKWLQEEDAALKELFKQVKDKLVLLSEAIAAFAEGLHVKETGGISAEILELLALTVGTLKTLQFVGDPPVFTIRSGVNFPSLAIGVNRAAAADSVGASLPSGTVGSGARSPNVNASGVLGVSWSALSIAKFNVDTAGAGAATVTDVNGNVVGTGAVTLSTSTSGVSAAVSGNVQYSVLGTGILSFYGPAESGLGVSGNWNNYSATVTGSVSITLTTDDLTLNGRALPAGTYTITTKSAALSGSGTMSSPNFAGAASITTTTGTLNLGPGSGNLTVGGKPLDPTDETTLDSYTGTISVSANGNGTNSVSLNGTAGNVLQVAVPPHPNPPPRRGEGVM